MVGRTIGKYRFVGQLGRGGMGTVYKAVDETLDREVAIKVLNPELADTDIMKRFRAEATTLAKLNHPEIATIYELFRSETDLLMVMEFVRGETLDKLSERLGPMPPDRAAYLIDKVLAALEHAHRAGIVHRDMKPANVMVTDIGGVKIMDFGIARVRGAEHMTIDGYMMGTPAYMPPEQVLGQEVDGRADLYSVGVVFYRLLTAALPFKADTAIGMVQKQISDAPTPLNTHREGLPDWCETILQRALAKSPADRFQTAEDFRSALGQASGIGMATIEHTKAFTSSDTEATTPPHLVTLERLGLTPADVQAAVSLASTPGGSVTAAPAAPAATSRVSAPPAALVKDGATIVLRKQHFAVAGSLLAVLTLAVAVLAYVALRGPVAPSNADATPAAPAASVPEVTAPVTTPPDQTPVSGAASSVPAPQPTRPPVPTTSAPVPTTAASAPTTAAPAPTTAAPAPTTAAPAPTTAAPAPTTAAPAPTTAPPAPTTAPPAPTTAKPPGAARGTGGSALSADPSAPAGRAATARPPVPTRIFQPITFDVKALMGAGARASERDAQLVLTETKVTVTDDNHNVLYSVPYDSVVSINYSTGRDPLWNSPQGPAPVGRGSGGFLGIRGDRHWVALRTKDAKDPFIVLRFNNPVQVKRGLTALEERTNHTSETVIERKDAK